jgi:hypothetical protein
MPLPTNRLLSTVIGYYLARFSQRALTNLGFTKWNAAYEGIAAHFQVNANYIKSRRDSFDPFFEWKRGWWQRSASPLQLRIYNGLGTLTEPALHALAIRILSENPASEVTLLDALVSGTEDTETALSRSRGPRPNRRAITGAAAEHAFVELHNTGRSGFTGNLHDHRHTGEGYDFLLQATDMPDQFIEVKGSAGEMGAISFTDREWVQAQDKGANYWLVTINSVHDIPVPSLLNNPAANLSPRHHLYPVIQVSWQVSAAQLAASPLTVVDQRA